MEVVEVVVHPIPSKRGFQRLAGLHHRELSAKVLKGAVDNFVQLNRAIVKASPEKQGVG